MEIIPGVYQITTGGVNTVNAFLISGDKLTLIDTGFNTSFKPIIEYIRNIGRSETEIGLIIITHNHPDHTGSVLNLKKLTNAQVAVHNADINTLPYGGLIRYSTKALNYIGIGKNTIIDGKDIDIPLNGGEVFPVAKGLEVINTPGHTPGSISLYSPEYKILFAGDLINNRYKHLRIPYDIINYDTGQVIQSVRRIAGLDIEILCVGHGMPLLKDTFLAVSTLSNSL